MRARYFAALIVFGLVHIKRSGCSDSGDQTDTGPNRADLHIALISNDGFTNNAVRRGASHLRAFIWRDQSATGQDGGHARPEWRSRSQVNAVIGICHF